MTQPMSSTTMINFAAVALDTINAIEIAQYVEQQFGREIHIGFIDHVVSKHTEEYEKQQKRYYEYGNHRLNGINDI